MASHINFIHSILIFTLGAFLESSHEDRIHHLPLTRVSGYGSIPPGLNPLRWKKLDPADSWAKCMPVISGVPASWGSDYVQNYIMIDPIQFAHQNYLAGNLADSAYNDVKKGWGAHFFKTVIDRSVKSYLNIIYRKTAQGGIVYRIDEDNDSDFSDEKDYQPVKNMWLKLDSLAVLYAHVVRYERVTNGRVVEDKIPFMLVEQGGQLLRNFPVHHEARIDGARVEVSSTSHVTFDFTTTTISLPDLNSGVLAEGEFFSIKGKTYKFLNVDRDKMLLRVQEVNSNQVLYSSQVGFMSNAFSGTNYITGAELSSSGFKGKYMYLDFWGTWCGPCLMELPGIRKVYETLDTTKVQFIGIAVNSDSKALDKIIAKEQITWPQIQAAGNDDVVDNFNISKYPTSFLIDQKGRIIAKDIPHASLRDTLNKYVITKP